MYNVERRDRPGETLDPEAMLSRYEEGTEFYIARQNSRRARGSEPKVIMIILQPLTILFGSVVKGQCKTDFGHNVPLSLHC